MLSGSCRATNPFPPRPLLHGHSYKDECYRLRTPSRFFAGLPLKDAHHHPFNIQLDGEWMVSMTDNVREFRPKPTDTEKIMINLGFVDLGQVDLMVQEGFYSNRTDFIRTAIRNQLERHADVVK